MIILQGRFNNDNDHHKNLDLSCNQARIDAPVVMTIVGTNASDL